MKETMEDPHDTYGMIQFVSLTQLSLPLNHTKCKSLPPLSKLASDIIQSLNTAGIEKMAECLEKYNPIVKHYHPLDIISHLRLGKPIQHEILLEHVDGIVRDWFDEERDREEKGGDGEGSLQKKLIGN